MSVEETINQNIEGIEDLIPEIDRKIEESIRRRRKKLKWTSILTIPFLSLLLYVRHTVTTKYEENEIRRSNIQRLDTRLGDYISAVNSILSDNEVTDGENRRIVLVKSELDALRFVYGQLGVEKNFTALEKNIANAEGLYQAELVRRRQVASLDKEFDQYKNRFQSILADGVNRKEREELGRSITGLEGLKNRYESLKAEANAIRTDRLESEVNLTIARFDLNERFKEEKNKYLSIAEEGFPSSKEKDLTQILYRLRNLKLAYGEISLETESLNNLQRDAEKSINDIKVRKLVAQFETEKRKYSSIAKDGFSISEEKSLNDILSSLNDLRASYTRAGLETDTLDGLLGEVGKSLETIKQKIALKEREKNDYSVSNQGVKKTYRVREDVRRDSREDKYSKRQRTKLERMFDNAYERYEYANSHIRRYERSRNWANWKNNAYWYGVAYREFVKVEREYERFNRSYGVDLGTANVRHYKKESEENFHYYKERFRENFPQDYSAGLRELREKFPSLRP